MRRPLQVLGFLALAVPTFALVKSCGFSARIDVIQSFYDRSEFLTAQRCGTPQSTVDLVYAILNGEGKLMTEDDPLFAGRGANAITVEVPEPFAVAGDTRTVAVNVSGNSYVTITKAGSGRGIALLMDNSASLNGTDENTGGRLPALTDPFDDRVAGAKNFVRQGGLTSSDRATVIAFHGAGTDGVDAKIRPTPAPSAGWFTSNTSLLEEKLGMLTSEENGKTPLYDALQLGVQALRTLPGTLRPILVVFSDGPDNSSTATFDDAQGAITAQPQLPTFPIAVGSLLGTDGEQRLKDLACATLPQGVFLKTPNARAGGPCTSDAQCTSGVACFEGRCGGPGLDKRFDNVRHLVTGYWRATLDLTIPSGLPSGTHTASGKVFAYPQNQPRQCEDGSCPRGMECDSGRNACFMRASLTISVP